MTKQQLPMAPGCTSCSRRDMLQGLGAAAVGAMVLAAGCGQPGSSLSTASSASCAGGECIDLANATNQPLTAAGGAMLIDVANDTVVVVRISDTQVVALSAICTHASCVVDYNATQQLLDCACHGSQFATDGRVVRGPATRPVRVYRASLANNLITVG